MKKALFIKSYLYRAFKKVIAIIYYRIVYVIENLSGLFLALLDRRKKQNLGKKILLCRNKKYSLESRFDSMEKYHIDPIFIENGYKLEYFFWDDNNNLFINQIKLWLKIRNFNPWIILFSSYRPGIKRLPSHPSAKYLEFLKKKMSSNFIFLWWDTCSDSFYEKNIARLKKIKSLHLIMDNPILDFGDQEINSCSNPLIPLWTNYNENSFTSPLKKDIDVAFLGQVDFYRSYRLECLEYLIEKNISGYFSYLNRDKQINHEEYAEILGRAKIGINFSFSVDKHQLKGRVFEIMHAGGLLLETKNPQTDALFQDGIEYVSFKNKEDLFQKIKYYLHNDHERKEIAKRGRNKVIKLYNTETSIKKILNHKNFIYE